ncbi:MAG: system potassium uptake protein [Aliidongia sp.]|nr:system potassium uptake protein [Aliidongia sp.]
MTTAETADTTASEHPSGPWLLPAVTALGIVFGDIGTSPLYAFKVALAATGHAEPTRTDVLGIVSLIVWALAIIVALKYVVVVLHADNEGEGGILALLSLVAAGASRRRKLPFLVLLGICGAGLLYGDGIITPAVSVLSAMEGLEVVAPRFQPWVIPATLAILVGLFLLQRRGTAEIGKFFGPVMLMWFVVIAALGIYGISRAPGVLLALDPRAGVAFLFDNPRTALGVFGAVFLALTGAEALYADMGHVGAPAIRRAWFGLVFPALLLNYFGQGGLLLAEPAAADNPFYKLMPEFLLVPAIALAAAATVIASQALISGVFSLTRQAIQMRLSPRMTVISTSSSAYGQIYVGIVNWGLMAATLVTVIAFRTSDNLASAYGIAVSGTMLITTILLYRVMRANWHWPVSIAAPVVGLFACIDAAFFAANCLKIVEGGWLPLAIGGFVGFTMIAWRSGNLEVQRRLAENSMPFDDFIAQIDRRVLSRLPGTGVFVTRMADTVSPMLLHQVTINRVLHEHVILLTVQPTRRPRVPAAERIEIRDLGHGFHRVTVKIGFMQRPDIPTALRGCARRGLDFCNDNPSYFIAHESLERRAKGSALPRLLWIAFNVMHRMGLRASDYFHLPPKSVMEVGFRLEL